MSHEGQHLPAPGPSATSQSTPTQEYGLALPSRARSSYSAALPPPPNSGTASSESVAAGAAGGGTMQGQDSLRLTNLERWAVHASDSQFNALAGATGGFVSGIVTCPLDVIKTKLQAQGGFAKGQQGGAGGTKVYQGLVGTASVIWKEEGIRGMYRGLGPIILGYLPTWAVWFTVYNKSKRWLAQDRPPLDQKSAFIINFWSSIIAGGSSTIVTNPIWVIKTRLMSQAGHHDRPRFSLFPKGANTPTSRPTLHSPWHYRSTWDAARKMYTTEGIRSFYSGLTPALLGLTHVAVQFPAYEYLKTQFTGQPMGAAPSENKEEGAHWWGILSASILSKFLASSATYPHEVIRTRLQTQRRPVPGQEYMQGVGGAGGGPDAQKGNTQPSGPKYRGVVMTFRTILAEEGWRAFYAGLGTNMMRAVPAATVTMLTYEYAMRRLNTAQMEGREKQALQGERVGFS